MITVLLVDDHAIVRNGLSAFFAQSGDIQVVGSASGGAEGIRLAAEVKPDVILMDISMPEIDGINATRQILAYDSGARVVMLTSFSDRERIVDAVAAGAIGYLLKDSEPDELLRGVRSAAAGDAPFSAKATVALLPQNEGPKLTGREREILTLVVRGLANKQIARELGISEKTVKAHLTSAFSRIGVSDRTQAALWANRNGLDGS